MECVVKSESLVTCGSNTFDSLWNSETHDPLWLTGRKTSSIYLSILTVDEARKYIPCESGLMPTPTPRSWDMIARVVELATRGSFSVVSMQPVLLRPYLLHTTQPYAWHRVSTLLCTDRFKRYFVFYLVRVES